MRLPDGEFVWGLGDNSTKDFTVRTFKAFMRAKFKSYAGNLADTNLFDVQFQVALEEMQDRYVASGVLVPGKFTRGVLDLATEVASGFRSAPPPPYAPTSMFFSINGAGSSWWFGYPFDIGESLDKAKVVHQPIGYDTDPFPMSKGVKTGVTEFVNQLQMPRPQFGGRNCTEIPWQYNFYSMGAIVGMTVMMRIKHGDLQQFRHTCLAGSTFGNPMRQHGHTFPGCSYSDGEGIVTPTATDCPEAHWDMACDKAMTGSTGDDLYSKMNKQGVDPAVTKNMRAVWDIVNTGNPLNLAEAVAMLLLHPTFTGGYDAAVAAFTALGFFVVKQTSPHVRYQFTDPIDGDDRDCWALNQEHAVDLADRLEVGVWD